MLTKSHPIENPLEITPHVFVYGTLQREFGNHGVMQSAKGHFLGAAVTIDEYPLLVEGLPYLHKHKGVGKSVYGEVYHVEDIKPLDRLESHPHFYKREVIEIALATYRLPCWTYFINRTRKTASDFSDDEMFSSYKEGRSERTYSFYN